MTAPGDMADRSAGLPAQVGDLNRIVQGLLIHCEWLSQYDIDPNEMSPLSRETLPVEARLTRLIGRDRRSLHVTREPSKRDAGTCRDFALLLCSMLRSTGTPARVRCGFASYFHDGWEDHWVCEYWDDQARRWRLSDAQLDDVTKTTLGIRLDASDLPAGAFLTATQAWLRCREGVDAPSRFGHADVTGQWFMKVNLIRDAAAMNDEVTSDWDGWRDVPAATRVVTEDEVVALDRVASDPESDWSAIKWRR